MIFKTFKAFLYHGATDISDIVFQKEGAKAFTKLCTMKICLISAQKETQAYLCTSAQSITISYYPCKNIARFANAVQCHSLFQITMIVMFRFSQ